MAKYKVGDKVRIVSERPDDPCFSYKMGRFLGKEITISVVREQDGVPFYYSEDAQYTGTAQKFLADNFGIPGYYFKDEWISGLAGPKNHGFSVSVRFHGLLTVAELVKDGKVVKVENARCNPKDKYSMAEGARIAVNRLFEKKQKDVGETANPAKKWKTGDRAVVVGQNGVPYHFFHIPAVVEVMRVDPRDNTCLCRDLSDYEHVQWVRMDCLEPYKEARK